MIKLPKSDRHQDFIPSRGEDYRRLIRPIFFLLVAFLLASEAIGEERDTLPTFQEIFRGQMAEGGDYYPEVGGYVVTSPEDSLTPSPYSSIGNAFYGDNDVSSQEGMTWGGTSGNGGSFNGASPLYYLDDPGGDFASGGSDDWTGWSDEVNPESWEVQLLPDGMIYPSYLAGRKEPRLASLFTHEAGYGWLWDITLGGRVPLFRFGTTDPIHPEGFQIDMEGAALLRLDFERHRNLAATDYRAGLPISYGTRHWAYKFAYYHVSSHLGDNYLLSNFRKRVHYVRDELVFGVAWKPVDPMRIHAEAGWAFDTGETTEPWEFQFGAEFSPDYRPDHPWMGSPFAAVCGHLFEELDFGGYFNSQIGWQWRNKRNSRFRLGAEFYAGCDDQFQFHNVYQKKLGFGFWYDF